MKYYMMIFSSNKGLKAVTDDNTNYCPMYEYEDVPSHFFVED